MRVKLPMLHPKYRPDIDGLRAVAILAVVAFHAFPNRVTGGFIGVDVFFVISGFLISTIIIGNLERGTFSFSDFYVRRIKRIFPALLVVMSCCVTAAWLTFFPEELHQLGKHLIAGVGFISNLVLWSESGYFDNVADTKPLLHLWSLGVEEQFYIMWPLLLWAAWQRKLPLGIITTVGLLASFITNSYLVHKYPVATFYSPLTRFWELLSGAILAWYALHHADQRISSNKLLILRNTLSLSGCALLLCALTLLNKELNFPGYWAVLPVISTLLMIGAGPQAWLNRTILSHKLLVWVGLISFPLYLWHWPLLSFGRILYGSMPPRILRICAVVLSFLLAWVTYKCIEQPIRHGKHHSYAQVVTLLGLMSTIAIIGLVLYCADFTVSHALNKLIIKRHKDYAIGSSLRWYAGKDQWLFLGNAYNDTIAKLKLDIIPSAAELNNATDGFAKISETAARFGSKTVLIIAPNKSSIYPEYLPDTLTPSPTRYISFFINKLREIPNLMVYDPSPDLLAAKNTEGILYWKTDTHWNNKGAYLAYLGLCRLLNLTAAKVSFKQGASRSGDLIGIAKLPIFPLTTQDSWDVIWPKPPSWTEHEINNEPESTFGISSVVSNATPLNQQYVWVIGDSFTTYFRQYFNATFKKIRYIGHVSNKMQTLPREITKADIKPDLILIIQNERFF